MATSKLYKAARAEVLRQHSSPLPAGHEPLDPMTEQEIDDAVDEVIHDWAVEAAQEREFYGEPEDTPCLENGVDNCDDWGTGEGRYHGRI